MQPEVKIVKKDLSACVKSFLEIGIPDNRASTLRRLTVDGKLNSQNLRPFAWKIFLNVFAEEDSLQNWVKRAFTQRSEYKKKVKKFLTVKKMSGDPLGNMGKSEKDSDWGTYYNDTEMKKLIQLDLQRTYQEIDLFLADNTKKILGNILFIWAKENPDISYKQGMNELLAMFYLAFYPYYFKPEKKLTQEELVTFADQKEAKNHASELYLFFHDENEIEADLFCIYNILMQRGIKDFFDSTVLNPQVEKDFKKYRLFSTSLNKDVVNEVQTKLNMRCSLIIKEKLKALDEELYDHFVRVQLDCTIFLQRWLKCIFNREFEYSEVFELWDCIFSNENRDDVYSFVYIDFIAVGMMMRIRDKLLMSDQNECFMTLFKYPPVDNMHNLSIIAENVNQAVQLKKKNKSVDVKFIILPSSDQKQNPIYNTNFTAETQSQNPSSDMSYNPLDDNKQTKEEKEDDDSTRKGFKKMMGSIKGMMKGVTNAISDRIDKMRDRNKEQDDNNEQIVIYGPKDALSKLDGLFNKYKSKMTSHDSREAEALIQYLKENSL